MLAATACTISVYSSHGVPFSSPADVVSTCSPILRCYGPKSSLSTWREFESRTWRHHLQEVCQGGPLDRPFLRSPEARKVAPWVQACLRSFTFLTCDMSSTETLSRRHAPAVYSGVLPQR